MWVNFFDRIFVINRPEDVVRAKGVSFELDCYSIPFQFVVGQNHEIPHMGIRQTLLELLDSCKHMNSILVYEDDVRFVVNPNLVMEKCVSQLKRIGDWNIFYQGVNTHRPFPYFITPNLLPIYDGYGLHAVAYSKKGMNMILDYYKQNPSDTRPIDVVIADKIQSEDNCYCSYPLLATQCSGYSNIEKKYMDQSYIESRYNQHIKGLL